MRIESRATLCFVEKIRNTFLLQDDQGNLSAMLQQFYLISDVLDRAQFLPKAAMRIYDSEFPDAEFLKNEVGIVRH
jgi:hypothetical protein